MTIAFAVAEREKMADYTDKQMVIDAVRSYYDECDEREESIEERIAQIPSAEKYAQWEYVNYGGFGNWHCTACRAIGSKNFKYCPYCGAKIVS